jgi:hypothetical protein
MSRLAPVFLVLAALAALAGCQTVPGSGLHNPNKALSEFDFDLYNCHMMVLQTTPPPNNPVANSVYSQCHMYGNVQQCWQQQAPIYPNQNPTPDPAWNAKVVTLTDACLARQGWRNLPVRGEGEAGVRQP